MYRIAGRCCACAWPCWGAGTGSTAGSWPRGDRAPGVEEADAAWVLSPGRGECLSPPPAANSSVLVVDSLGGAPGPCWAPVLCPACCCACCRAAAACAAACTCCCMACASTCCWSRGARWKGHGPDAATGIPWAGAAGAPVLPPPAPCWPCPSPPPGAPWGARCLGEVAPDRAACSAACCCWSDCCDICSCAACSAGLVPPVVPVVVVPEGADPPGPPAMSMCGLPAMAWPWGEKKKMGWLAP
mmetsp:Transcript_268/g.634  ORF Transcript_268/g.634 Transcript_268/m.634 type:complete len:243 (-) Transcript_268:1376-2104(-)